ncbi:MAG TPA: hypothetical protein VE441_02820 [Mycobacterium sp.]|nr:hypothetical protein [Mycobacterium sp.]
MIFGKGHTWADRADLCARCEQLFRAGDDEALVALLERSWPADVDESHRKAIAAFRRADLGPTLIAEWWPPGVARLVAEGFTPLEDLTGDLWIAAHWPQLHRRSVPETRDGWDDLWDDGRCWLVRSPWPSVPVSEAIRLLWIYVHEATPDLHRRSGPGTAEIDSQRNAAVARFLSFDEQAVASFGVAHSGPGYTDTCT